MHMSFGKGPDPLVKIKIGVQKFSTEKSLCVESVMIEKSIGFEASIAEVVIWGKFEDIADGDGRAFEKFGLSKPIEIELSDKSSKKNECVFSGFIMQRKIEKEQNDVRLIITCGDIKNVMMNYASFRSFDGCATYSDIASQVLSSYSNLCKSKIEESLPSGREVVQSGQSDYDFLIEIAKKTGCQFFVELGVVQFVPIGSYESGGLSTISKDLDVLSIWLSNSCYHKKDKVIVFSQNLYDEKEPLMGTSIPSKVKTVGNGKEKYVGLKSWIVQGGSYEIVDNSVLKAKEAEDLATAKFLNDSMDFVEICCKINDFVFAKLNSLITFKDFGSPFDAKYKTSKIKYFVENKEVTTEVYARSNTLNLK